MAELFLGEDVDVATHARNGTKVLLPSGDLTTHAVVVGMTGSGKTGLGIVLVEECLRSGIPALLIDPKGDLTNLALTFPELAPAEFRPWVNEGDAAKAGVDADTFAAQQAAAWRDGLASWGLAGADIGALRATAEISIYTPGSSAGMPLNIVGTLQAPADTNDLETLHDEIEGYVSGLLGLVGIDADPLASREHILLSNLIETSWAAGRDLDLATLVGQVQTPPIRKLGVFELDTFFPPNDRLTLAMKLNGLLAAPSFAAWMQGSPVDIDTLLRTPDGRPRAAIVTTAMLSDAERQFVTTLVLSKLITWMRRQSGTTDLRALLYLDEVAGYLPPTAVPPTKKPLMTLMKQARAFGVGVVLSTQNPVDIDYKAISNAGTWMIGRLQTERDKARLLDGMTAAAGTVDVGALSTTITGLGKREFVLRRASKDTPETFTTRWAMSYLRGPLTRDQISALTGAARSVASAAATTVAPMAGAPSTLGAVPAAPPAAAQTPPPGPTLADDETAVMPKVADGVPVRYIDVASPWLGDVGGSSRPARLDAAAVARVRLRYDDEKAGLVHDEEYEAVLYPLVDPADPTRAISVDYDDRDLRPDPPTPVVYRIPQAPIGDKGFWSRLQRDLVDTLVRSRTLQISANSALKLYSRPGESDTDFATRCAAEATKRADADMAALRTKYEDRIRRAEEQLNTARDRSAVLDEERKGRRWQEVLSTGGSILGSLLGGKRNTRSMASKMATTLGSAAGRRRTTSAAEARLEGAQRKVDALSESVQKLEDDLARELNDIDAQWAQKAAQIATLDVPLERNDVSVAQLVLGWMPID